MEEMSSDWPMRPGDPEETNSSDIYLTDLRFLAKKAAMAYVQDTSSGTETGQYAEVQDTYDHIKPQDVHLQYNNNNYETLNKSHVIQPSTCSQVVTQPARVTSPYDFLCLSVFSCLCCIWPIGAIAICFSHMSNRAHYEGDISSARKYGYYALGISIFSIVGGITLISVFFSLWI